jgi:hypothetical protein
MRANLIIHFIENGPFISVGGSKHAFNFLGKLAHNREMLGSVDA